jgi:hypothetical protein
MSFIAKYAKHLRQIVASSLLLALAACSGPEPGSTAWCEDISKKAKGDWTANEAMEYSKSCLFK